MVLETNLRVGLQDRRSQVYRAGQQVFDRHLGYLLDFVDQSATLRVLTSELEAAASIDPEAWAEDNFSIQGVDLPPKWLDAAAVSLWATRRMAREQGNHIMVWGYGSGGRDDAHARISLLTERLVDPFVTYLHQQLDDRGSLLVALARYKLQTEWFSGRQLAEKASADSRHTETILDLNLREFLFHQGVDYPFSTPLSPSGRTDIAAVLGVDTSPTVLEIKIFDPEKGYGTDRLRQGVNQARAYANDFNQSVGYLVVFNFAGEPLLFEGADDVWPPRLQAGDVSVVIVTIELQAADQEPASKRGTLKPRHVRINELVGVEQDEAPS
jgi:hypothetical protein